MKSFRNAIFSLILIFLITTVTLVTLEVAGQILWRIQNNDWYFNMNPDTHLYQGLFEPHPYLVVVPKPGARVSKEKGHGNHLTISHNSLGFRGPEVDIKKPPNVIRIVTLGGSTTYCVSVSDDQTWPFLLEKQLGPGYQVINLGVPGYSTVENIIQTALILPELHPDVAIFYLGWNDVRNVHIANLKSDYSGFHGKTQNYNLNLNRLKIGGKSVLLYYLHNLLSHIFTYEEPIIIKPTKDEYTDLPDQRALYLYGRNVQTLITLCKEFHVIPVLVPQVLNYSKLMNNKQANWAPYLKNKNYKKYIQFYNEKMQEIANKENALYVSTVLKTAFISEDFLDEGHFNAQGNKKFAAIMASVIKDHYANLLHQSYSFRDSTFRIHQGL